MSKRMATTNPITPSAIVKKAIEIVGVGTTSTIVWEHEGVSVLDWRASSGRIANITFRQLGSEYYTVEFNNGSAVFEDNDVSSLGLASLGIHSGANPVIRSNKIHNSGQSGISVYKDALGTIENNEIYENGNSGIQVRTGSKTIIRNNKIMRNESAGIFFMSNSSGTAIRNEIFENKTSGVQIGDAATPI